jgi:hypothetical protein
MYAPVRQLVPESVRGLYRAHDVRLTPRQLAEALRQRVSELARLCVPVGADGLIGRAEMSAW